MVIFLDYFFTLFLRQGLTQCGLSWLETYYVEQAFLKLIEIHVPSKCWD